MPHSSAYRADRPISASIEIDDYDDYDSKRQIPNITATSVSSFPDSNWPSDSDGVEPYYPNAKSRPAYRVGSLRRNERLSPSSLRPPKHSSRRRPGSRGETGRPRSRGDDAAQHEISQESQPAPLVLLHVTLLPPHLPWSRAVLDTVLPLELKRQFGLLRAATSGLVAQRGILIAHPREEFELLEESVLEALDLLPERIGYDGQYRPRTPNTVVDDEEDYGEETQIKACDACQRFHIGDMGWLTRVYAANGLIRAGAWGACWSEMERVDVEIRPCILELICRRLDDAQTAEDGRDATERHNPTSQHDPAVRRREPLQFRTPPAAPKAMILSETAGPATDNYSDLPHIYHPKDVPLRLLLRNYIYLLIRDHRNFAVSFLVFTLLASTCYGVFTSHQAKKFSSSTFESNIGDGIPSPVSFSKLDVGHGKRHPLFIDQKIETWMETAKEQVTRTTQYSVSDHQAFEDESIQSKGSTSQPILDGSPSEDVVINDFTDIRASVTDPKSSMPNLQADASDRDTTQATSVKSPNLAFLTRLFPAVESCPMHL